MRIDLRERTADVLISERAGARGARSWRRCLADGARLPYVPASQTPWQEIQRGIVDQLAEGMVLKPAVKYQDIAHGPDSVPRDNH